MADRSDVRATYDRIGRHFAKTRPEPWEEVSAFLDDRSGGIGLDVGAGNGRHTEVLADCVETVLALDASWTILSTATQRASDRGFGLSAVLGDAARLPVRTGCVDLATYIATIHHLPTRSVRRESLDELARVLGRDGAGLVSTWAVTHERFDRSSGFDVELDWTLPDGETVPRFYHIYDRDEFERDLEASALRIEYVYESAGNFYAVVAGKG